MPAIHANRDVALDIICIETVPAASPALGPFLLTKWTRLTEPTDLSSLGSVETDMKEENAQIVETAVEARGGFLGRSVLLVLIASVALAIAFMVFSYVGTPRP
jgi:hypothetical protein